MNDFVEECQKEWRRLGVPTAAANEMAADLRADLAEAAAEGVSAEHVLGNGVFDPRSFAADWATARGLVDRQAPQRRLPRLLVPIGLAAASVLAIIVGLALVIRPHASVAAVAIHRLPIRLRPPLHAVNPGPINQPLGLALFGLALAGLVVALVLSKPWQLLRARRV
jgi:hypothetical protein